MQPNRYEALLPVTAEFGCDAVIVLWGSDGMPRDENERAMHAAEISMKTAELGIPNEKLWIDPIVSPVSVEITQVKACITFMQTLQDIVPGCKSTVGLSNISNGAPDELRTWLNRVYLVMLGRYGLYSAIVDAFDEDLLAIAAGNRKDIEDLVYKVMDGEAIDKGSLNDEMLKYFRTAKVLVGDILYSDSWLEG